MAHAQSRDPWSDLDEVGEEEFGHPIDHLSRGGGSGALLWMDRRTEGRDRCAVLAATLCFAATAKQMVEDQPGQGSRVNRRRPNEGCGPEGGRTSKSRWPLGGRVRPAQQGN